MGLVTQLLNDVEASETASISNLMPLVYQELRQLARARLRKAGPGQTLQATALVHEVYLRLVSSKTNNESWKNRAHFFAAASEAMRRIVIDLYRRKNCIKRGGKHSVTVSLNVDLVAQNHAEFDMLSINEALEALEFEDPQKALLVKLRCFCGMSMAESANILDVSLPTAERSWRYARAFLANHLQDPRF